ncbi:MAG: hypothetical protein ACFCD0_19025 [Gemmataceae bacterium]
MKHHQLLEDSQAKKPTAASAVTNGDATATQEAMVHELRLYGGELILRSSDNCTLVAFAGIALQEIRGRTELAHNIGSGLFLLAVLLCAVVHFCIGNSYLSRARRLLKSETTKRPVVGSLFLTIAWIAGFTQFLCIALGLLLVLPADPLPFLDPLVDLFR